MNIMKEMEIETETTVQTTPRCALIVCSKIAQAVYCIVCSNRYDGMDDLA